MKIGLISVILSSLLSFAVIAECPCEAQAKTIELEERLKSAEAAYEATPNSENLQTLVELNSQLYELKESQKTIEDQNS